MNRPRSQKEYETEIASSFIARLPERWELLSAGESPDFVIRSGSRVAGLEMAGYREQDARNAIHAQDDRFKQFILERWLYDASVHHFGLCLIYRRDGDRFLLPPPSTWEHVLKELRDLVGSLGCPAMAGRFPFELYDSDDQAYLDFVLRHRDSVLTNGQFPSLCSHFSKVVIDYHPSVVSGLPHTSGSCGTTGPDRNELQRVIRAKIAKTATYRSNLPDGAQLWLLLHNDGYPITAHIANERIMDSLLESARSLLTASGAFDRVFWLNDAFVRPVGLLREIEFANPADSVGT